jgi:hypothetical protein
MNSCRTGRFGNLVGAISAGDDRYQLRYQHRYQSGPEAVNDKGLLAKAFIFSCLFWLPDLGSNQGPTD